VHRPGAIGLEGDIKGKPRVVNGKRLQHYFVGTIHWKDRAGEFDTAKKVMNTTTPARNSKIKFEVVWKLLKFSRRYYF
jgi:hypothetical protein